MRNDIIQFSAYEWLPSELWGEFHPDHDNCYFNKTAIKVNSAGEVGLLTQLNRKVFDWVSSQALECKNKPALWKYVDGRGESAYFLVL